MLNRSDRRRHERHRTNLKVKYALANSYKNTKAECIISNISYGGAKLDVREKLKRKIRLFIEITLNNLKIDMAVIGKIIWVKEHNDTATCGIKFDWFSDKDTYIKYMRMCEIADSIY